MLDVKSLKFVTLPTMSASSSLMTGRPRNVIDHGIGGKSRQSHALKGFIPTSVSELVGISRSSKFGSLRHSLTPLEYSNKNWF